MCRSSTYELISLYAWCISTSNPSGSFLALRYLRRILDSDETQRVVLAFSKSQLFQHMLAFLVNQPCSPYIELETLDAVLVVILQKYPLLYDSREEQATTERDPVSMFILMDALLK